MTACPGVGTESVTGPATVLVAIQNRAPAPAQQVGRLDPSSAASRTGRHAGSATDSTASAIPAANQPVNDGSHRSSGAADGRTSHSQASQTSPSAVAAPSPTSTPAGRSGRFRDIRSRPAAANGSAT